MTDEAFDALVALEASLKALGRDDMVEMLANGEDDQFELAWAKLVEELS